MIGRSAGSLSSAPSAEAQTATTGPDEWVRDG